LSSPISRHAPATRPTDDGEPAQAVPKTESLAWPAIQERLLRRVLHIYWRLSRGLTLGVRGLIIDADRRIFLVKHTYVAGWHLPGGGVEIGETVLEALGRELKEEGNIELLRPPPLHGMYFNIGVSRRDHVALFVVEHFRQTEPPQPNREIADHGFFALDDLPGDTSAATRARIAEVMTGAPVSPHW
jgi:ADP-ribose pyrophosphatase YjhB (NUDIX family)